MKLDYTNGCVNFRDVGEWINEITGQIVFPVKKIFRGGKIDFIDSPADICNPRTIVNLRKGPDPDDKLVNLDYFHFPISNDYEKYETDNKEVRKWLNYIFMTFEKDLIHFPVFFHCTSGKDRTGVVVAALLKILNMNDDVIVEEYLLSDGKIKKEWIVNAIKGIDPIDRYFNRVDLSKIRSKVMDN